MRHALPEELKSKIKEALSGTGSSPAFIDSFVEAVEEKYSETGNYVIAVGAVCADESFESIFREKPDLKAVLERLSPTSTPAAVADDSLHVPRKDQLSDEFKKEFAYFLRQINPKISEYIISLLIGGVQQYFKGDYVAAFNSFRKNEHFFWDLIVPKNFLALTNKKKEDWGSDTYAPACREFLAKCDMMVTAPAASAAIVTSSVVVASTAEFAAVAASAENKSSFYRDLSSKSAMLVAGSSFHDYCKKHKSSASFKNVFGSNAHQLDDKNFATHFTSVVQDLKTDPIERKVLARRLIFYWLTQQDPAKPSLSWNDNDIERLLAPYENNWFQNIGSPVYLHMAERMQKLPCFEADGRDQLYGLGSKACVTFEFKNGRLHALSSGRGILRVATDQLDLVGGRLCRDVAAHITGVAQVLVDPDTGKLSLGAFSNKSPLFCILESRCDSKYDEFFKKLLARKNPEMDFSNLDLQGINFSGANLSKANLSKANLSQAIIDDKTVISIAQLKSAKWETIACRVAIPNSDKYVEFTLDRKTFDKKYSGSSCKLMLLELAIDQQKARNAAGVESSITEDEKKSLKAACRKEMIKQFEKRTVKYSMGSKHWIAKKVVQKAKMDPTWYEDPKALKAWFNEVERIKPLHWFSAKSMSHVPDVAKIVRKHSSRTGTQERYHVDRWAMHGVIVDIMGILKREIIRLKKNDHKYTGKDGRSSKTLKLVLLEQLVGRLEIDKSKLENQPQYPRYHEQLRTLYLPPEGGDFEQTEKPGELQRQLNAIYSMHRDESRLIVHKEVGEPEALKAAAANRFSFFFDATVAKAKKPAPTQDHVAPPPRTRTS